MSFIETENNEHIFEKIAIVQSDISFVPTLVLLSNEHIYFLYLTESSKYIEIITYIYK